MSYRRGPNSPALTSTATWSLIAVAISACCAAVVSLLHTEKPAWKTKAYSLPRPRKFAGDRKHVSLTGEFIQLLKFRRS